MEKGFSRNAIFSGVIPSKWDLLAGQAGPSSPSPADQVLRQSLAFAPSTSPVPRVAAAAPACFPAGASSAESPAPRTRPRWPAGRRQGPCGHRRDPPPRHHPRAVQAVSSRRPCMMLRSSVSNISPCDALSFPSADNATAAARARRGQSPPSNAATASSGSQLSISRSPSAAGNMLSGSPASIAAPMASLCPSK